ncbi:hypothetical protein [Persephonella sp.]|uniref:hypothetical protein n=1 Tax=Persephonella sp. TaxID=2060922 RepID=UPI0025D48A81|nr:hypothetical protein [Persephonella sp.]
MRLNKFFIAYVFSLFLSTISLSVYLSLREVDQHLYQKINDLKMEKIKINDVEKKVNFLVDYVKQKGIKTYTEKEALEILLNKADSFIKLYDAVLKDELKKENGYYSVSLGFDYYPDSSHNLFSLLIDLKNQISPVVMIKKLRIENLNEGTKVYLEIELIQPFLKEE